MPRGPGPSKDCAVSAEVAEAPRRGGGYAHLRGCRRICRAKAGACRSYATPLPLETETEQLRRLSLPYSTIHYIALKSLACLSLTVACKRGRAGERGGAASADCQFQAWGVLRMAEVKIRDPQASAYVPLQRWRGYCVDPNSETAGLRRSTGSHCRSIAVYNLFDGECEIYSSASAYGVCSPSSTSTERVSRDGVAPRCRVSRPPRRPSPFSPSG